MSVCEYELQREEHSLLEFLRIIAGEKRREEKIGREGGWRFEK